MLEFQTLSDLFGSQGQLQIFTPYIYISLVATPAKVLAVIDESESMNASEERIFTYPRQLVGNMKPHELGTFLRFISGSSVCLGRKITITFNNLEWPGPKAYSSHLSLSSGASYLLYQLP